MIEAPDRLPDAPDGAATNVLADVLELVHVSSAVFLKGEFTSPWAFASVTGEALAQALGLGSVPPVLFHVVIEGRCRIRLASGESALISAGEAVVLPYCDMHTMGFPPDASPVSIDRLMPMPPWETIPTIRHGPSGGSATRILCGYLQCRDLLFDPFLKVLPPLLHVRPEGAQAEWFAATTRYALQEAGRTPKEGLPLFTRLPELLFIDCLRRFAATGASTRPGVFLGLRDPVVGRALVKLHRDPARPWTVPLLARECAVSRSVLADRFTRALGVSPMQYLTRWRLQLAAHRLATSQATLAQITETTGYESEAAFSRAFKRHLGTSPAQWRENLRSRPS